MIHLLLNFMFTFCTKNTRQVIFRTVVCPLSVERMVGQKFIRSSLLFLFYLRLISVATKAFFFFIYTMLCVVRKGDGDAHVDWFVFWRRFLTCGWCSSGCMAEEKNRGRVITQGECAFETAIVPVNNALSAEHAPLYLQTEMNERRLSAPLCRILWWNFNQRPEDVFIRRERCHKTSVLSPAGRFQ